MLPLRVRVLRTAGRTVVSTRGEIDLVSAPDFERRIMDEIDAGCRTLVINLSHTSYVDSSALAAMLRLNKEMRRAGGKMSVMGCRRHVARVLDVVGFRTLFPIEPLRSGSDRHAAFATQ
jgi:anti-anti-sigma factor